MMDFRNFDIDYNVFVDLMGEDFANNLQDGQDVTDVFSDDNARPVEAIIIQAVGPGGGNPYVHFVFENGDHSWEWASTNLECTVDDYELAEAFPGLGR